MPQKNTIRAQQTQQEKKPNKTKSLVWKLIKGVVSICGLIYRVWRFFEGDDAS